MIDRPIIQKLRRMTNQWRKSQLDKHIHQLHKDRALLDEAIQRYTRLRARIRM